MDARLGPIGHGPGEVLGVGPFGRAAGEKESRNLLAVEVFLSYAVSRRAGRTHDGKNTVFLDELAGLFDGFRGAEAVDGERRDLVTIHAT